MASHSRCTKGASFSWQLCRQWVLRQWECMVGIKTKAEPKASRCLVPKANNFRMEAVIFGSSSKIQWLWGCHRSDEHRSGIHCLPHPVCMASSSSCMPDLWEVLIPVVSQVRCQLHSQTLSRLENTVLLIKALFFRLSFISLPSPCPVFANFCATTKWWW